ncbi:MAG TPA: ABC transporter ATP-binding protein [Aggregatilineaceae bacterium]|nr:ABC transporter ATP-binding protein [Aggregatilineaceae bacterium]
MARLIRDLVRPYRSSLVFVLLAMTLETLAGLAEPWPLKVILDNVVNSHRLPGWMAQALSSLPGRSGPGQIAVWAAVAVVFIAAVGAGASYLDSYLSESVAQRIAHDLRMRTYHHLQRLSLSYYDKHQVSTFLSTLTTDIETIQDFASSGTLAILVDVLSVAGMLLLMLWLNWRFALIAALTAPFVLWYVSRFKRAVKKATRQVRQNQADIVAVEISALQSQRVVEAFGTEGLEEARLGRASSAAVQSALAARRIKSSLSPVVAVTVAACTGLVIWRGANVVLEGSMTVGVLTVFLSYLGRFFKPVQDLAKMTTSVAQTAVATERVQAILGTDDMIPEPLNPRIPRHLRGEIAFDRVSFRYDVDTPVLREVSFKIEPGQFVGIVGPTGSGKSTIVSLIPRFYEVTSGRITIDSVDIREYQLHGLRQQFGFVLQDTVLFRGTVGENIAYGRPEATAEEVVEAARLANAHEFIERLPNGYQTVVGDRGLTLSGGQRQRLGIARALVRNSPILILDEPTSALDVEAEGRVMEALTRLMKGRTAIMIAHRLATLRDADKVIVFKDGIVAEEGTHRHLLSLGGVYAALHKEQQLASAEAAG